MTPEEMKASLHQVITAHATENAERAAELFHDVLQAKMRAIMHPPEQDVDPEDPDNTTE